MCFSRRAKNVVIHDQDNSTRGADPVHGFGGHTRSSSARVAFVFENIERGGFYFMRAAYCEVEAFAIPASRSSLRATR